MNYRELYISVGQQIKVEATEIFKNTSVKTFTLPCVGIIDNMLILRGSEPGMTGDFHCNMTKCELILREFKDMRPGEQKTLCHICPRTVYCERVATGEGCSLSEFSPDQTDYLTGIGIRIR